MDAKVLILLIILPSVAGAILLSAFLEEGKFTDAPSFTITDVDGATFRLSECKGKIVVLEFMATWCRYCKAQVEELKKVHEQFRNPSIIIVSISIDPSDISNTLRDYRDELGATWIFAQSYEVGLNYSVKVLPTTVIIDYKGRIRFRHEGVVEASELIFEISQLLNEME
ncbi:MAG: TlpA disulfide reductase family protein [Candidatus Bathyarchaeia archaeon]